MRHLLGFFLFALLACSAVPAQTTNQKSSGEKQNMSGMHDQMMKSMQADLDALRANLQKMKDQLSNVKDSATKDQFQLNIQMWQSVVDDMDKHMQMMQHMMGGGMMDHGSMQHKGMQHDHGASPTPTPKP